MMTHPIFVERLGRSDKNIFDFYIKEIARIRRTLDEIGFSYGFLNEEGTGEVKEQGQAILNACKDLDMLSTRMHHEGTTSNPEHGYFNWIDTTNPINPFFSNYTVDDLKILLQKARDDYMRAQKVLNHWDRLQAFLKENPAAEAEWKRFMMTMKLTGGDQHE